MAQGDRDRLVNIEGQDDQSMGQVSTSNEVQTQEPTKYTSQIAALLITVNVTIGIGLLAMPYAVQTSGIVTSAAIQIVFLLMVIATCIMCTELTAKSKANSYHGVVKAHCPDFVYKIVQVSILLIVFGTTVAFIVIIGDQADRLFASKYGPSFCFNWYMNRRFIMSAATVFILKPLCSAKTVDFLKYASFAGVLSLGFVIYLVISEFVKQGHIAKDVNYFPNKISDIGTILPVFCLAYQCHLSYIPTAATIRKEDKYTTYKTVSVAMIVATVIYLLVSVVAALTFGSKIQNDLTESYSGNSWLIPFTIVIVAIKCMTTLPPAFLPLRLSLVDILNNKFKVFSDLSETTKRVSVTYVSLSTALILALFVPDILLAVDIIGCISVIFIFVVPPLCYLNLINENRITKQRLSGLGDEPIIYTSRDKKKRLLCYFLIISGSLMTVLVLYKSIDKLLSKTESQSLCHV